MEVTSFVHECVYIKNITSLKKRKILIETLISVVCYFKQPLNYKIIFLRKSKYYHRCCHLLMNLITLKNHWFEKRKKMIETLISVVCYFYHSFMNLVTQLTSPVDNQKIMIETLISVVCYFKQISNITFGYLELLKC